jgi:predicted transcriptional regulator
MEQSKHTATRVSVRLTPALANKLQRQITARRTTESVLVREALERYFEQQPESCYDAFVRLGLAGSAKGLPADLSANKKYFKEFGK